MFAWALAWALVSSRKVGVHSLPLTQLMTAPSAVVCLSSAPYASTLCCPSCSFLMACGAFGLSWWSSVILLQISSCLQSFFPSTLIHYNIFIIRMLLFLCLVPSLALAWHVNVACISIKNECFHALYTQPAIKELDKSWTWIWIRTVQNRTGLQLSYAVSKILTETNCST